MWAKHNAIPPPIQTICAYCARDHVPLCCVTVHTELAILLY